MIDAIAPESSAGRALRGLCQSMGPVAAPRPIVIGRRKTRPDAPYRALVRLGLAVDAPTDGGRSYEPTDAGRTLAASWSTAT